LTTKKEEVNHRDTENTEAKQKRSENMEKRVSRQGAATQRKEEKYLCRLNKQFEFQFIVDDAGNSLRLRVFARVFSPCSLCG